MTLREAVAGSDVIVTVTPATTPFIGVEHLDRGALVVAVGADSPQKRELSAGVLSAADAIITDLTAQAAHVGELHHGIDAGEISAADVRGELGDVVSGRVVGRRSEDEIIIYDSTGTAVQDAAAAALLLVRATAHDAGTSWDVVTGTRR